MNNKKKMPLSRYLANRLTERSTWAAIGTLAGAAGLGWLTDAEVSVLVDHAPQITATLLALMAAVLTPTGRS
ncbi:hypothetical protein [Veronia pacifica]|uniref:hypothetical protein n=1 Tax=Veronia pacifica TaxID=1080227 RepID=UPI00363A5563